MLGLKEVVLHRTVAVGIATGSHHRSSVLDTERIEGEALRSSVEEDNPLVGAVHNPDLGIPEVVFRTFR